MARLSVDDDELVRRYVILGQTLEEIAAECGGVTRERVRQKLARYGVTWEQSARRSEVELRKQARRDARAAEFTERRGFSLEWQRQVRDKYRPLIGHDPYRVYENKRRNVRRFGKDLWQLTYPQWLQIWIDSGHILEMGLGRGRYNMTVWDRSKPWDVANVRIVEQVQMVQEMRAKEKAQGRVFGFHRTDLPTEELARRYVAGETLLSLATEYKTSEGTVSKRLRGAGVKMRVGRGKL